ncbi:hypothetical protein ACF5W4_11305 [Bacillota bacterium Lsc_1132]
MIRITAGDINDVKAEMKEVKKASAAAAAKIVKKYGGRQVNMGAIPQKDKAALEENRLLQERYNVTRTIPAYVGGMIIDYKTASDFVKKLKGFEVSARMIDGGIEIKYWRMGRRSKGCGYVSLYDLSRYFKELKKIPTAEIDGLTQ